MMKSILACLALLSSLSQALDVEISEYSCDKSLPVTADLFIKCSGTGRCTFGNKALVYGTLHYSGAEYSGIENNMAYITSELSLLTIDFSLFDMMVINLCSDDMTAVSTNYNECPGDGSYSFSVPYRLPTAGQNTASWLATGWEGSGYIRMYAEEDESMLIGECLLTLQTARTPDYSSDRFIKAPTAAATAGIVLGVAAVIGLGCMYCYCCMRNRRDSAAGRVLKTKSTVSPEDSLEAVFKRMEDEKETAGGPPSPTRRAWANPGQRSTNLTPTSVGTVPMM